MEYQVPQFIEIESKVVGPLTLKQFIYLAGSAGICVTFFIYLPILFAFLCSAPIAALGVSLAFYKINGKPLIAMLEAGFNYYIGSKFFLWKRHTVGKEEIARQVADEMRAAEPVSRAAPRLTSGKLSELAWSLDVQNHEREVGGAAKPK